MMGQRCYLPDLPRIGDDYCHIECLQLDAYRQQREMLALQGEIRNQLVLTNDALRQLTRALNEHSARILAAGGASGGES